MVKYTREQNNRILNCIFLQDAESPGSPSALRRNLDDSVITSPSSEVVMRRSNIRKSNTVAYRGDRANKWKRASINGHIYNYDVRNH